MSDGEIELVQTTTVCGCMKRPIARTGAEICLPFAQQSQGPVSTEVRVFVSCATSNIRGPIYLQVRIRKIRPSEKDAPCKLDN